VAPTIPAIASEIVAAADRPTFVDMALRELGRINEGNTARYRVRLPECRAWREAIARSRGK
jgi:hypothetical protein